MKVGARVLVLWLDMSSGPSDPSVVLRPQGPRSRNFLSFHDFIWFLILEKMRSSL